jgi:hypothetical protein
MNCQYCKTNPADSKRRPLCHTCYTEIHKQGLLDDYPLLPDLKFNAKLKKKYGKSIFRNLEKLKNEKGYTLQDLGTKYGFTREYARQIFGKYFGFPYTYSIDEKRFSKRNRTQLITAYAA